jgi:hypothetical protein
MLASELLAEQQKVWRKTSIRNKRENNSLMSYSNSSAQRQSQRNRSLADSCAPLLVYLLVREEVVKSL